MPALLLTRTPSRGPDAQVLGRVRDSWQALVARLWVVPALIVAVAVVLAGVLVESSGSVSTEALSRYPRLFGAGAAGARGMLSTIAGSMITVAGVTFSITISAVAQTSAQYTPRVLRTFMSDLANQVVLGTFVGIFAYCLVVLRTIRAGDEGSFVPPTAVLGGFVLALFGVGVLVYFIVHMTQSLQAASILDRVRQDTESAVDRLFPRGLGTPADLANSTHFASAADALMHAPWQVLRAHDSGYVQEVDEDGLLAFARQRQVVVRMDLGVGQFAVAGAPLAAITPGAADGSADEKALNALYTISPYRTVTQDSAFGILQIVDIALKALSPGINDTTTAVSCVGHLTAILARIAPRPLPNLLRGDAGTVRVLAIGPTFQGLVSTAFDDVRRNAAANVTVLTRLLDALHTIGACTPDPVRRRVLARQVALVIEAADRKVEAPGDRRMLVERADAIRAELDSPGATATVGIDDGHPEPQLLVSRS